MIDSQDGAWSFTEEFSMEAILIVFGFATLAPFAAQVAEFLAASRRRRRAHSYHAVFTMDPSSGDKAAPAETTIWYDRAA